MLLFFDSESQRLSLAFFMVLARSRFEGRKPCPSAQDCLSTQTQGEQ
jgi:hypothetical protein